MKHAHSILSRPVALNVLRANGFLAVVVVPPCNGQYFGQFPSSATHSKSWQGLAVLPARFQFAQGESTR